MCLYVYVSKSVSQCEQLRSFSGCRICWNCVCSQFKRSLGRYQANTNTSVRVHSLAYPQASHVSSRARWWRNAMWNNESQVSHSKPHRLLRNRNGLKHLKHFSGRYLCRAMFIRGPSSPYRTKNCVNSINV